MDDEMIFPRIYDNKDGIKIEIPVADGIFISIVMHDKEAQDMVDIIQNKLNARL